MVCMDSNGFTAKSQVHVWVQKFKDDINSVDDILKSGEDECTVTPECTVINVVMYDKYYNKLK
jgi:hypothetical protein